MQREDSLFWWAVCAGARLWRMGDTLLGRLQWPAAAPGPRKVESAGDMAAP